MDINNYILKVDVVDDPDRRTAEQYAKEHGESKEAIESRYAATGDLVCDGGYQSQANVVLNRGTIVTAGHSVFHGNTFGKNPDLSCKFITKVDGHEEIYEIESLIDTGLKSKNRIDKAGRDWAILKLKKEVSSKIKPYSIDPKSMKTMIAGVEVMSVGKSNDFPNKGWGTNPRHYGDCKTTALYSVDDGYALGTNCDMSPGDSGGALATRGKNPVLLAVHEGGASGQKRCKVPPNKTSGPSGPCWNTSSTWIAGEFLEALQQIPPSDPN